MNVGSMQTPAPPVDGTIRVVREPLGGFALLVDLPTALGHLSARVALEPEHGATLAALTQGQAVGAPPVFGTVAGQADAYAAQLDAAAAARGTAPAVLRAAKFWLRAKLGDTRAKSAIDRAMAAAQGGDPEAQKKLRLIRTARAFAREILGAQVTGSFLGHLGTSLEHAARSIGRDAGRFDHHVLRPVMRAVRRWGPMILSDMQGLVSLVPGIGTGISAAIGAAEAIVQGGGPLAIAIHTAYGAVPIPPGLRPVTDVVLDTVLEFVRHPKHLVDVGIAAARDRIPKGLPQEIFDTLMRIVVKHRPVIKAAESMAGHVVGQYTQGLGPSLARSVSTAVGPEVAAHLARLPDPGLHFQSIHRIAPHFAVNPADAALLVMHGQRAAEIALDPAHTQALTVAVAQAAIDHAKEAAALRVAQQHYLQPRVAPPAGQQPAELGIQVSPDGQAARMHASPALAPTAQTISPGAALS
jgi:hypothetical protein